MPITINEADNVATIDESDGLLGCAIDGVVGMATGENLTSKEASMGGVVVAAGCLWAGSHFARKRMSEGKEPVLGIFF